MLFLASQQSQPALLPLHCRGQGHTGPALSLTTDHNYSRAQQTYKSIHSEFLIMLSWLGYLSHVNGSLKAEGRQEKSRSQNKYFEVHIYFYIYLRLKTKVVIPVRLCILCV